ncbi:MAG: helix-turn-helix domain-containing protein [Gemmataceae bacterium]
MKTVFTTGEAAKIPKVSQQTIIRCFDNGQLRGFRVPGSKFRRIPREALYKFMKDNSIPTDALESGKRKVLLVDDDVDLVDVVNKALQDDGRFEVHRLQRVRRRHDGEGISSRSHHPGCDAARYYRRAKRHRVRADSTMEEVRIICILGMIEEDKIQELKLAGRRRLPEAVRCRCAYREDVQLEIETGVLA